MAMELEVHELFMREKGTRHEWEYITTFFDENEAQDEMVRRVRFENRIESNGLSTLIFEYQLRHVVRSLWNAPR